jgi:hypothetical protein
MIIPANSENILTVNWIDLIFPIVNIFLCYLLACIIKNKLVVNFQESELQLFFHNRDKVLER